MLLCGRRVLLHRLLPLGLFTARILLGLTLLFHALGFFALCVLALCLFVLGGFFGLAAFSFLALCLFALCLLTLGFFGMTLLRRMICWALDGHRMLLSRRGRNGWLYLFLQMLQVVPCIGCRLLVRLRLMLRLRAGMVRRLLL